MKTFNVQRLNELLALDVATGKLYWKPRKLSEFTCQRLCNSWNTRLAGKEALSHINESGHMCGTLDGRGVYAHKVVWALLYGEWPSSQIDHLNHVPNDNRPENLRLATQTENCKNKKLYKANVSGLSGVRTRNGKWCATIKINGKDKWLGTFDDRHSAISARMTAQANAGYHANHGT